MKLTEAKLKQLILETMEYSDYFYKLKTLMTTEEGFMQAQSLFEMIEDTLDPKEKTFLRSYFGVIDLAKEVVSLEAHSIALEEKYHKLEDELLQGAPLDAEEKAARSELIDTIKTFNKKQKYLARRLYAMMQHGDRKIYDVIIAMIRKMEASTVGPILDFKQ